MLKKTTFICTKRYFPQKNICNNSRLYFTLLSRSFAKVKISIETEGGRSSSKKKYTPNFLIDFKKDRFLLYKIYFGKVYLLVGIICLLFIYSAWQIIVKWNKNSRTKNIICTYAFVVSLVGLFFVYSMTQNIVKSIHLLKCGTKIEVRTFQGFKPVTLEIAKIKPKTIGQKEILDMVDFNYFVVEGSRFVISNFDYIKSVCHDPDMLQSILDATEVDVKLSGEHPTITL